MTNHMTEDRRFEGDRKNVRTTTQALAESTVTSSITEDTSPPAVVDGLLSRPNWMHCGSRKRLIQKKATLLQPPAAGFPWSRWRAPRRWWANVGRSGC